MSRGERKETIRRGHPGLRRLQTDWIDLYQLHVGDLPVDQAGDVANTLEELCDEGLIRYYGWSTDDPERAGVFGNRARAVAVQFDMNVFQDAPKMLETCDTHGFAGIVRQPLAMGFLSGKFVPQSRLPADDIRGSPPTWLRYFDDGGGAVPEWTERLASIKEILTSRGRTLAQGALAWVWGRNERTISIPGVRTVAQVEDNLGAIEFGPLGPDQMREIDSLLERP
jgi:aryl-alcohol dehydrogenase-like predicted oxidoreductase